MKKALTALLAFASLTGTSIAADKPSENSIHAVAIVNDQVISSTDLNDRIKFVMFSAGLPDTAEVREKVTPQVVHMLVDEALQLQEATKNDIKVSEEEIKKAEAFIEQRNGHPPGSMEKVLDAKGIPKIAFYSQLRAQLAWTKLLQKTVRQKVHISDEEILRASSKSTASQSSNGQVQISVLRLPTDTPKAEKASQALAEKLYKEIKGGASFEKVAAQFTSGGGEAISQLWVDEAQVDPLINKALKETQPGHITPPIKTQNGIQIVKLENRRGAQGESSAQLPNLQPEAELAIRQITLTLKPDAKTQEASLMLGIAKDVAKNPGTCFDKNVAGIDNLSDMDIKVTNVRKQLSKLSSELRKVIENVAVGGISEPFASPSGIELYQVCERTEMPATATAAATLDEAEKERIRQNLFGEKMELEVQKYMRSLRRDAFIDVRI